VPQGISRGIVDWRGGAVPLKRYAPTAHQTLSGSPMIRASTASRFCPAPCSLNISQKIPPSDSCFILQLHNTSAPSSSAPICLSRQTDRRSLEILCVGISTAIAIAIGTGTRTGIGPPHCSTHHQPVAKPPPPNYHFATTKSPPSPSPRTSSGPLSSSLPPQELRSWTTSSVATSPATCRSSRSARRSPLSSSTMSMLRQATPSHVSIMCLQR